MKNDKFNIDEELLHEITKDDKKYQTFVKIGNFITICGYIMFGASLLYLLFS